MVSIPFFFFLVFLLYFNGPEVYSDAITTPFLNRTRPELQSNVLQYYGALIKLTAVSPNCYEQTCFVHPLYPWLYQFTSICQVWMHEQWSQQLKDYWLLVMVALVCTSQTHARTNVKRKTTKYLNSSGIYGQTL